MEELKKKNKFEIELLKILNDININLNNISQQLFMMKEGIKEGI